jgi:hypothetical protein
MAKVNSPTFRCETLFLSPPQPQCALSGHLNVSLGHPKDYIWVGTKYFTPPTLQGAHSNMSHLNIFHPLFQLHVEIIFQGCSNSVVSGRVITSNPSQPVMSAMQPCNLHFNTHSDRNPWVPLYVLQSMAIYSWLCWFIHWKWWFSIVMLVYQRVYLLEDAFQNTSEQQNHTDGIINPSALRAHTLQSRRQGQSEEKKWILKVVRLCFQSRTRRKKIHLVLEYICACCWKYVKLYDYICIWPVKKQLGCS